MATKRRRTTSVPAAATAPSSSSPAGPAHTTAAAPMRREANGEYAADDFPGFRPNVSPAEMFRAGIFGGTYFRDISVNGVAYKQAWREFAPRGVFDGLDVRTQVASGRFDAARNRYGVSCGQSLDVWVEKGWIVPEFDSHGWVHWYCRFFFGRRCADDARQVARWLKCAGPKGRWRRNLIAKCVKAQRPYHDEAVSPVVRQTLLHWAYELTQKHHDEYRKMIEKGQRTSFIPQVQMQHLVKCKKQKKENSEEEEVEENRDSGPEERPLNGDSITNESDDDERPRTRRRRRTVK